MTSSNITTNQFVRIDQTPASIAERVIARIIDMVIAGIIGTATMYIYFFELDYETKNQLNYLFFFLIAFTKIRLFIEIRKLKKVNSKFMTVNFL